MRLFKYILNQMRAYRDEIIDQRVVKKLLVSLARKYNHIVTK